MAMTRTESSPIKISILIFHIPDAQKSGVPTSQSVGRITGVAFPRNDR